MGNGYIYKDNLRFMYKEVSVPLLFKFSADLLTCLMYLLSDIYVSIECNYIEYQNKFNVCL